jgi:hypothetical protein
LASQKVENVKLVVLIFLAVYHYSSVTLDSCPLLLLAICHSGKGFTGRGHELEEILVTLNGIVVDVALRLWERAKAQE